MGLDHNRDCLAVDYRLFDETILAAQDALVRTENLPALLSMIQKMCDASLVSMFCYDDDDETILDGVSLPGRLLDIESLRAWQADPEMAELTRRQFDFPHRLTDLLPAGDLAERPWYKAQFEDVGLDNGLLQDFTYGGRRCRLILLREAPSQAFDCEAEEVIFRLTRQLSRLYGQMPKRLSENVSTTLGKSIPLRQPDPTFAFEPRLTRYLRSEYELSQAEARAAYAVSDGCRQDEAAERIGISINTLKTHLKRVYEKMGIRRSNELVHRIVEIRRHLLIGERAATPH